MVANKDITCFMNARQLLVLKEWGTFYNVKSCVGPLRDQRIPRGAKFDMEIVDGSHIDEEMRWTPMPADCRVKGVEAVRTSPSLDWDTRPTHGIEERCHRKTGMFL